MKLTIEGPPRTKKNSLRRIKRGRRIFTVPSAAHEAWEALAIIDLRRQLRQHGFAFGALPALKERQNMAALVYRARAVGDLLNYLAAVSDALEKAGVVADDKLITRLDGSRLLLDAHMPRVEIELTPCSSLE